jgi:hypothetical protein
MECYNYLSDVLIVNILEIHGVAEFDLIIGRLSDVSNIDRLNSGQSCFQTFIHTDIFSLLMF